MSPEQLDEKKYVYLFTEIEEAEDYCGGDWDAVRGLLGGKGANLADMTRLGVPVPPGFTITTEACNAYVDAGGALRVGPESAGADPGPACYGQGGEEPTNTDANLVLGRLGDEKGTGDQERDEASEDRADHASITTGTIIGRRRVRSLTNRPVARRASRSSPSTSRMPSPM